MTKEDKEVKVEDNGDINVTLRVNNVDYDVNIKDSEDELKEDTSLSSFGCDALDLLRDMGIYKDVEERQPVED